MSKIYPEIASLPRPTSSQSHETEERERHLPERATQKRLSEEFLAFPSLARRITKQVSEFPRHWCLPKIESSNGY
ncbi:MAG: hypothetical protein AAFX06_31145 [Planctomycetota bacterium]